MSRDPARPACGWPQEGRARPDFVGYDLVTTFDALHDMGAPVGRAYYGFSTLLRTPASLFQQVGLALGTQAGPTRIRDVVETASRSRPGSAGGQTLQWRHRDW